ncbi:uncharacterized protein LOC114361510 isoform X2 [Ostrinia furnacalis]|uniref:uncharacterized protein LOC114361510 isoform X2 n=1 Tax=Ostrinia furnacalis TaxID=93504 RepID=UPI00103B00F1|nr:uncharacterized protein LOC114361510 isoform X2 [Ostrinia furnacalis]
MCDHKLSSDEVPAKFAEWLLSMGCPPEKVPTVDKVVEMCRGQYYMVWRSLMEHVESKDTIRQKRLRVFCDDIYKYKRKNAFNKPESNAAMPEELTLWHQHNEIKEKVADAEERVAKARETLNQLTDKITNKLSHRNLSQTRVQQLQRRAWLLQQVADDLKTKKENLEETKAIANSLCTIDEDVDVQSKLDKYISSNRRGGAPSAAVLANPVASSSLVSVSDANDSEEQLSWLPKCRGDALWTRLAERRAGLAGELAKDTADKTVATASPQAVLSHTAALHCMLALEALKNRAHIKQTRKRLATAVSELNNYLSGEACELLVLRCEKARSTARVNTLRTLLDDVTARSGVFNAGGDDVIEDRRATGRQIAAIDKAIESKKEEVKKLVTALATTEKKMHNVRECLIGIFNGFHKDQSLYDNDRFKAHLDFPQESVATLRQFYEERREKRKNKVDLSMDLDVSDNCSLTDPIDITSPKFVDELKIYLKKFNLENNRKLVLESGQKIWVFESVQSAIDRFHNRCQNGEVSCALLSPSVSLSYNLQALVGIVQNGATLRTMLDAVQSEVNNRNVNIDISLKSKEEAIIDKIKKRLNENLLSLQKSSKTLELGQENLKFWSSNEMRKYISPNRTVDGKSYKDYETIYLSI